RWERRNSPISRSVPVTDGMAIRRLVSSNGFICTFQRCGNPLTRELTLVTEKMYDTVPVRLCELRLIIFTHIRFEKDTPDFSQCRTDLIADFHRHLVNRAELLHKFQRFFRADALDTREKVRANQDGKIHQLFTRDAVVSQQRAHVYKFRYDG